MDRRAINLLGILSITPLIYFLMLLVSMSNPGAAEIMFKSLFPLGIAVWLTGVGVLLIFSVFLIRSKEFTGLQKVLWLIVLFVFNFFSLPVFWWLHFKQPPGNGSANLH